MGVSFIFTHRDFFTVTGEHPAVNKPTGPLLGQFCHYLIV